MERNTDFACTGWTASVKPTYATKASMLATRDLLLSVGYKEAAAALDNAIDLIQKAYNEDAEQARLGEAITDEAQNFFDREAEEIIDRLDTPKTDLEIDIMNVVEIPTKGYDYHLLNGFTEQERRDLITEWNDKYSRPPFSETPPKYM